MEKKPTVKSLPKLSMKTVIIGVLLVLLAVFLPFLLIPKLGYYYWGDETRQVIPLTIGLYRDIRAGTFGTWGWAMSFGASNAIQFLSYLGSPSFWLMVCLPKAEMILSAFPAVKMLSMFLSAVFACLWVSDLTRSELSRAAGTVIMTFCGWAVFQQHYYSYLDAWMYICLLLYVMEEVLQGRKKLLFPIVIAMITVLDLFTMYMASWLILFYMITRLAMMGNHAKDIFLKLVRPFLLYLLGLGMAGAVFVMDTEILLASSRVNQGILSFLTDPEWLLVRPMELFRVISSLFSPVINDYDYNLFSSPFLEGGVHTYALFSYSFIVTPLLFPQVFRVRFEGKKPLLFMIGILAVCTLIPDVYVIFNGNTAARWCFLLIVFHVMLDVFLLEQTESFDMALLKRSCIGVIVLIAVFSLMAAVFHLTTKTNLISIAVLMPMLGVLVIVYANTLMKKKQELFALALLAEALICMYARVINGTTITAAAGERKRLYESSLYDTAIIDELKENDPGFYRISSDEPAAENYLLPMAKQYLSSSSYFSLYNNPSENYYYRRITETWFIPYSPAKFLSYSVFGNKYLLSYQGDHSFIPGGYEPMYERTGGDGTTVRVFRNLADTGLGTAADVTCSQNAADSADRSLQDYLLAVSILTNESKNTGRADQRFEALGEVNNTVLEHSFNEPGTLYIDYSMTEPYGAGSYELYRSGEVYRYREFNEYGFYAVHLDEPADAVGIYTHNANFPAAEISARLYWISDANLKEVYKELNARDRLKLLEYTPKGLKAEITITDRRKTVASSIAFHDGWRVSANGKEIETKMVNTSFLGFTLDPGTYEIEMSFTPSGWNTGKYISLGSILLYGLLVIWQSLGKRQGDGRGRE